ncbi:thioredoxin fold domain-containing protein [Amphritea sp. HPY]|uniref:thioredoxin fold domain-containing protein n=1 Tax=Amphritea sp. HPY TaxID=3421652 RepID=UPI003D7E016D
MKYWLLSLLLLLSLPVAAGRDGKQVAEPVFKQQLTVLERESEIPQPDWFKDSFLDLGEDLAEAAQADKLLVLYFHQAGCPYCYNLITRVFADPLISKRMQSDYDLIALDLWGDRIITLPGGEEISEKELAVRLRVQYTPTLIFLSEDTTPQLRIDGYRPAGNFLAQLERLGEPAPETVRKGATAPATTIDMVSDGRPLALEFVTDECGQCLHFESDVLERSDTRQLISGYRHIRINISGNPLLKLPSGEEIRAAEWVARLGLSYYPAWLLFDDSGEEQLRIDSYVRAFHFNSALDYVAGKSYLKQPEFQRFINARGDRLRARGKTVHILD